MSALKLALVWLLSTCVVMVTADHSYVDPTDVLNFDSVNIRMKDKYGGAETKSDGDSAKENCPPCTECVDDDVCVKVKEKHETSAVLLRQYSLSLVRLMESQVSSTTQPTLLDIRVMATYHGLSKLRKFGDGSSSDFHALHETLTSMMQYARPVVEESGFSRFYWLEDKLGLSFPMMAYMTVLILSSLLLVVAVSHIRWRKALLWRSIIVIFIISVVMTMVEMYQAVAVALVKTVVTPMNLIGQGIKNFLVGLLKGLPMHIQTFVLVCLFFLLILWPLLLMGYNFNLFYLINIGPARVVKEIQYVKSESSTNDRLCEQEPSHQVGAFNLASATHPQGLPPSRPQAVPVAEASTNNGSRSLTWQAPPDSRQSEANSRSVCLTPRQPVAQASSSQRAEAAILCGSQQTPDPCGGGDSYTAPEVKNRDSKSSVEGLACGNTKSPEPSGGDLCRRLEQVAISQASSSETVESQARGVDVSDFGDHSQSVPSESTDRELISQDNENLTACAEVTAAIQKITLEEKVSLSDAKVADALNTKDDKNIDTDNIPERE
ncbi:chloride channel CLIC-like protein 1 [Elysia marginata]|uniref:Chloride channel CLIC-like protein 1 n=1 Tax=Elysia marginata TaxID=1093978 RepID=A0AAV4G978_9GAST|nr:chloride channel CLIC-like protein 1 [Elysia marginata]